MVILDNRKVRLETGLFYSVLEITAFLGPQVAFDRRTNELSQNMTLAVLWLLSLSQPQSFGKRTGSDAGRLLPVTFFLQCPGLVS